MVGISACQSERCACFNLVVGRQTTEGLKTKKWSKTGENLQFKLPKKKKKVKCSVLCLILNVLITWL